MMAHVSHTARNRREFRRGIAALAVAMMALALLPLLVGGHVLDKMTTLFVYIMLALCWNALAGYVGLVSVGQQGFFGLGAYLALVLVERGLPAYPALLAAPFLVGLAALPLSFFLLRLKGGEFAISMWVAAEAIRILVMLDPAVQGETGTSLIALNAYAPEFRRNATYLLALAGLGLHLLAIHALLGSRQGEAIRAIRDDEEAAASIGIEVMRAKRLVFVAAAIGCAFAGAVWLASAITFQPRTNFGVQWSVSMLFMVLVGGIGTFVGPIVGAVLFFLLQEIFGDFGVWYLAGLGLVAIGFALFVPEGLVARLRGRFGRSSSAGPERATPGSD